MKNKAFFFALAAMAVLSCKKDPNYSESGFVQGGSDFPYVYASVADTKASLDGSKVSWQKGDMITVYGNLLDENYNETATYIMKNDSDVAEGRFTFNKMICGKKLTALKSAVFGEASELSSQTVGEGVFPACLKGNASSAKDIDFEHISPYSKLILACTSGKTRTIFKARIVADAIGGVDADGMQIDTLTLAFSPNATLSEVASEYVFRTAPIENKEVKCILYDTDGGYMETDATVLSFADGSVTSIPAIDYEPKKIVTYYPGTELEPITVREIIDGVEKNVLWAPVYCGYSPEHPNGLLYQYGRAVGQTYYPAGKGSSICKAGPVADPLDAYFYSASADWYGGTALTFWPMNDGKAGYVYGKIANPCPSGWRLPTVAEAKGLIAIGFTQSTTWSFSATGSDAQNEAVEVTTGFTLKDESGLFLAAVGGRTSAGQSYYRGSGADAYARMWCSDIESGTAAGKASCLNLRRKASSTEPDGFAQDIYALVRASAISVRCVKNN